MDKQQEQMNQNQEVKYTSGFLEDEEENVEESEFDEPAREQGKIDNLPENQQDQTIKEEQPKKPKRPRKTIEQELAELDARRQLLMERKRKQEAHEKIVFGATVIAMLNDLKAKNSNDMELICNYILSYSLRLDVKNKNIIEDFIDDIKR